MEGRKMLDIMNNLTKTAIVGTALTVGLSTYDEMTPPAATYFQEVQVAPLVTESEKEDGFVQSKIESEPTIVSSTSVVVDLVAKGPPKQDDYPRLNPPKENDGASVDRENYGLVKIN